MKPRNHSLNHVVCDTMTAIAVTPTINVQMKATTCRNLRATVMTQPSLERLTDAEVNAPWPRFRLAVDLQVRNAIQLIPEVDACGPDRGEVSQSGTHGVHESRRYVERPVRHVAEIEEGDASDLAKQRFADFGRSLQHRQSPDRKAGRAERADFEATPPADARCATEEVTLEEWHAGLASKRVNRARMNAVRPDE